LEEDPMPLETLSNDNTTTTTTTTNTSITIIIITIAYYHTYLISKISMTGGRWMKRRKQILVAPLKIEIARKFKIQNVFKQT
jgi:hypothetical protein